MRADELLAAIESYLAADLPIALAVWKTETRNRPPNETGEFECQRKFPEPVYRISSATTRCDIENVLNQHEHVQLVIVTDGPTRFATLRVRSLQGVKALERIQETDGLLPDTVGVFSITGDFHLIYRLPVKLVKESRKISPGLELVYNGEPISIPPTRTKTKHSAWYDGVKSTLENIAPIPDTLLRFVAPKWCRSYPYFVHQGRISKAECHDDEWKFRPMCEFNARIVKEVLRDNGLEPHLFFELELKAADGSPLGEPALVGSEAFASMAWVLPNFGTAAIIHAGNSIQRDELREAIQKLSVPVQRKHLYSYTGWKMLNGKALFLHAGGALGVDGNDSSIDVDLGAGAGNVDPSITPYALPDPPRNELERISAIESTLKILKVAPLEISIPLLAAIGRAPLGEILQHDFSLFLAGPSGTHKSCLAALAQAHFGACFSDRHLPGSWISTENALERQAFTYKDTIFTIDDYVPGQGLERKADRVIRAQANGTGRFRLTRDASLREAFVPRSLIIATGEDVPQQHSLRSRMAIIDVKRGDVNLSVLSELQSMANLGVLAQCMSAYVRYLAGQMETLQSSLRTRHRELRSIVLSSALHKRTPDLVASLFVGFEKFLEFALEEGALNSEGATDLYSEAWDALARLAKAQEIYQASSDPVEQFVDGLRALFAGEKAHVVSAQNESMPDDGELWGWQRAHQQYGSPRGQRIGWVDDHALYLIPDLVFSEVQRLLRDQGCPLSATKHTLFKRIAERGLIRSEITSSGVRHTVKKQFPSGRLRVLCFPDKSVVLEDRPDAEKPEDAPQAPLAPFGAAKGGLGGQN